MHGWIRISIFGRLRRRLGETEADKSFPGSPTGFDSFVNVGSVWCLEDGETISCMLYAALTTRPTWLASPPLQAWAEVLAGVSRAIRSAPG